MREDDTEYEKSPVTVSRGMSGTQITLCMVSCAYSFILYEWVRALFFLLFSKKGRRSVSFRMRGRCLSARCLLLSGMYLLLPVAVLFLLMGANDYKTVWLLRYFEAGHWVKTTLHPRDADNG